MYNRVTMWKFRVATFWFNLINFMLISFFRLIHVICTCTYILTKVHYTLYQEYIIARVPLIIDKRVSNFHISYQKWGRLRLNGFLQRIVNWYWFYKPQVLIDTAEYTVTVTCISIIMGINLVCHKYGIVTWRKNYFWDLFINCYTCW